PSASEKGPSALLRRMQNPTRERPPPSTSRPVRGKTTPVPPPASADGSRRRRHWHLVSRTRKWLHVNLELARFVRLIGDPAGIGRKLAVALFERPADNHDWFPLTHHRQRGRIG